MSTEPQEPGPPGRTRRVGRYLLRRWRRIVVFAVLVLVACRPASSPTGSSSRWASSATTSGTAASAATLRVGDQAPDVELTRYDGSRLRLSSLWAEKPVVLVFGSCT